MARTRALPCLLGSITGHLVHACAPCMASSSIVRRPFLHAYHDLSTPLTASVRSFLVTRSCSIFAHRSTYHIPAHIAVWTRPDFPPCRRVHTAPSVHRTFPCARVPCCCGVTRFPVQTLLRGVSISSTPYRPTYIPPSSPPYRLFSLDHSLASPAQINFNCTSAGPGRCANS